MHCPSRRRFLDSALATSVVAEGKVFAKDAQGTVSAFNADTGALLWRVTLAPEKARDARDGREGRAARGEKGLGCDNKEFHEHCAGLAAFLPSCMATGQPRVLMRRKSARLSRPAAYPRR